MVFKLPVSVKTVTPFLLVCLCTLAGAFSCKKIVEKQAENIIIDAMTNGKWYVEQYVQADGTDLTPSFAGYDFQFYEQGTVDGLKNNSKQSTGTWNADISAHTILAAFPASANDTLKLLNDTWKITDSYLDYVKSSANGKTLYLRKE